jgi:hypothetical protein
MLTKHIVDSVKRYAVDTLPMPHCCVLIKRELQVFTVDVNTAAF